MTFQRNRSNFLWCGICCFLFLTGAVYITSIREPFQQFTSMFNYYKLPRVVQMPATVPDPITEYLHNLTFYEAKYTAKGVNKRYCFINNLVTNLINGSHS